jgi:mRNA interferase MazF
MTPIPGEVYLVDMGLPGKVRPVVIVSREDPAAPRALAIVVPLTTANRGTHYEVELPSVSWLKHKGVANVQAMAAYGYHELLEKRGRFEPHIMEKIKAAIIWALDL